MSILTKRYTYGTSKSGFTIVELLIVIVVIGILAAITIVAYNGITQKAAVASLQSDLNSASKQLAIDQVNNSAYPATLAAANNGVGLKASSNNTYSYIVNNTISPAYYCLGEANTTSSLTYFVTSTSSAPQVGGCSVTNLVTNPSVETNTSNWSASYGTGGAGTSALTTGSAYLGNGFYRMTWTTGSSDVFRGAEVVSMSPVSANLTYTASAWVRLNRIQRMTVGILFTAGAGTTQVFSSGVVVQPNTWTRLSVTATADPAALSANVRIYSTSGASGTTWQAGDTLDVDATTLTQGATLYTYADGSSLGWIWNGTANASTSTGPPL